MNQTALITGASKRIGRSIAEHLAEKGWSVVIHCNNSKKEADELVASLKQKYPNRYFSSIQADIADAKNASKIIPQIISETGVFQLLINNASVFNSAYIHKTSNELYENQMNVNLMAPFILTRDFAVHCKNGNIINLVDTRLSNNKSKYAAYSLSKKGLWELTKMAALEFGPDIRVNAIAPGLALSPPGEDDNYLNNLAANIPMKKPGGVAPILKSVDFILDNDYLTGQLLYADGGENLGQNS
jgi:NAD(P)-dependent dehydrogenase (short-subunit alcohol dehydrogenase family)